MDYAYGLDADGKCSKDAVLQVKITKDRFQLQTPNGLIPKHR